MPSPPLTSPRTGPTLTAAGRRLKASTTIPRTTSPRCRRLLVPDVTPASCRMQPRQPCGGRAGCRRGLRGSRRAADQRPAAAGAAGHAAGPGEARRLRRGCRRGGDLPARHRGAERLPVRGGALRRDARRHQPGALHRPHHRQAAGDATHPVHVPARGAAAGVGERLAAGRPAAAHPAGQGGGGPRHREARRGLARPDRRSHPGRGWPRTAGHHGRAAGADPAAGHASWSWRPASPTAATSRSLPACSARWRRPARSSAAPTRATGVSCARAGP